MDWCVHTDVQMNTQCACTHTHVCVYPHMFTLPSTQESPRPCSTPREVEGSRALGSVPREAEQMQKYTHRHRKQIGKSSVVGPELAAAPR